MHLLNLSDALGELCQKIEIHLHLLTKFTKCFIQVQQMHALKLYYEDLCWPLIDSYKLAVTHQYLYLLRFEFCRRKKWGHFFAVILRPGWNHPYVNKSEWILTCACVFLARIELLDYNLHIQMFLFESVNSQFLCEYLDYPMISQSYYKKSNNNKNIYWMWTPSKSILILYCLMINWCTIFVMVIKVNF